VEGVYAHKKSERRQMPFLAFVLYSFKSKKLDPGSFAHVMHETAWDSELSRTRR
jgi:hypothetical protein